MNLVIDAGNTTVKLAVFSGARLKEKQTVPHGQFNQKLKQLIGNYSLKKSIISNVWDTKLHAALNKTGMHYMELTPETPLPFRIRYQTPHTLGRDRIAAVAGAYSLFPTASTLTIDAGTAITYDIMDAAHVYHGGNISPGVNMRFKALNEFTHALPLVQPGGDFPETGNSTENAIKAGVLQGVLFEMLGYIKKFTAQYKDLKVIMTGGESLYFADKLKKFIFVENNLVSIGLNTILEYNAY